MMKKNMHLVVTGSKSSKVHLAEAATSPIVALCGLKMSHEMTSYTREIVERRWGLCSHCEKKEASR